MSNAIKRQIFSNHRAMNYRPLILRIKTDVATSANEYDFQLNITSSNICLIDWGDGNTTSIISGNIYHTYASKGEYIVKVYGGAFSSYNYSGSGGGDGAAGLWTKKIIEILQWGNYGYGIANALDGMLDGAINLEAIANDCDIINQYVTSATYSFRRCLKLTELPATFTLPNLINGSGAFSNCPLISALPSGMTLSNLQNGTLIFYKTKISTLSNGITTNSLNNANSMFEQATLFNSDISSWNVSNVTNMQRMFQTCTAFNQNISSWNVSNVTTMQAMFQTCTAFNQNISSWNVSNVTTMQAMFQNCTAFNQDISSWNFNKNVILQDFMAGKSSANYSAVYYSNFLNKLATCVIGVGRTQTNKNLNMGTIKYDSSGASARAALVADGWIITDGGL